MRYLAIPVLAALAACADPQTACDNAINAVTLAASASAAADAVAAANPLSERMQNTAIQARAALAAAQGAEAAVCGGVRP